MKRKLQHAILMSFWIVTAVVNGMDLQQPPTSGVLTVLYETDNPGGKYGNMNVQALWLEKADGTFVKTLDSWGQRHDRQLSQWIAADKAWKTHARTGATLNAFGTFVSRADVAGPDGQILPDGDYILRLEMTNDNAPRNKFCRAALPFCKSTQPAVIGILNQGACKRMMLVWRPGSMDKPLPKSTPTPLQKDPNMILDQLNSALMYGQFTQRITQGLALLNEESVLSAPIGKHQVQGDDLFYTVDEYQTKPFEEGRPEIHNKYLDIQYIVSGTECIGFCPLEGLTVDQPYDSANDIAFYKHAPGMSKLALKPGMFAIFWPSEPHMPCRTLDTPQSVRKIVVKVRME